MSNKRNIIRRYDYVKIINPHIFLRCGYPLTIQMMKERMTSEQREAVNTMFKAFGVDISSTLNVFELEKQRPHDTYDKVINILASMQLHIEGWGGRERKIYTEHRPELEGKIFQVIGGRVVKTGTYQPASSSQGYYDYYPEYEPAYLGNCKTHVIIELNKCDDIASYRNLEIERCNVELVTKGEYSYAS